VAQIDLSGRALEDLERLAGFLVEAAPETAIPVMDGIIEAIGTLKRHPLLGRRVEGEKRELVISHGTTGYIALYRFDAVLKVVRVLRIRHQRESGYVD
jgi:plasmid stabilization system protein ParE